MNTTKSGLRTVLAAAAAGALVLGSAGGALAHPGKAKSPKAAVQLQSVSIHGHSLVNFYDISETDSDSVRDIRFRATVRDRTDLVAGDVGADDASTVKVTLGVFDKKVKGTQATVENLVLEAFALPLTKEKKRSKNYATTLTLSADQKAALKAYLTGVAETAAAADTATPKTYLCIADADLEWAGDADTTSKQVKKRLGKAGKRPVRDCVKLVDMDPDLTKTVTDD